MKKVILPLLLAVGLCGCYNDNEEDLYPAGACNTTTVTYAAVIKPIITANCATAGCHSGAVPANGINLDAYAGLKTIAASGQLIGTVTHASGFSPMPQNLPKLSQCNIEQITKWVTDGALDN